MPDDIPKYPLNPDKMKWAVIQAAPLTASGMDEIVAITSTKVKAIQWFRLEFPRSALRKGDYRIERIQINEAVRP